MIDFKEIKKITNLFLKKNQKKIDKAKLTGDLNLENIFNELIKEIDASLKKKNFKNNNRDKLPHRRKGYTQKASINNHKVYLELVNILMDLWVKFLLTCIRKVQHLEA